MLRNQKIQDIEKYRQDPSLKSRSFVLGNELENLKSNPKFAEFAPILTSAIYSILNRGRLDRREKRKRVIKALCNYTCELGEIADETQLERGEIIRILKVLHRAKMLVVKKRKIADPKNSNSFFQVYFLKDSE